MWLLFVVVSGFWGSSVSMEMVESKEQCSAIANILTDTKVLQCVSVKMMKHFQQNKGN